MDRPIRISIKGGIPEKVICPSCQAENVVPEQTNGMLMYRINLHCMCGKEIFLECRL